MASLARAAQHVVRVAAHRAPFICSRPFASLPAAIDPTAVTPAPKPVGAVSTAAASPPPPPAAAAPTSKSAPPSGSAWQRLTAFVTGVGVSSVWFFYAIDEDMKSSTREIESSLTKFKSDVIAAHADERQRLARLEHEVAELKRN